MVGCGRDRYGGFDNKNIIPALLGKHKMTTLPPELILKIMSMRFNIIIQDFIRSDLCQWDSSCREFDVPCIFGHPKMASISPALNFWYRLYKRREPGWGVLNDSEYFYIIQNIWCPSSGSYKVGSQPTRRPTRLNAVKNLNINNEIWRPHWKKYDNNETIFIIVLSNKRFDG